MTSIPITDNHGNAFNLKIQPASDGSGEYVLVINVGDNQIPDASSKVNIATLFDGRHIVYFYSTILSGLGGEITGIRVAPALDDTNAYIIVGRSDT